MINAVRWDEEVMVIVCEVSIDAMKSPVCQVDGRMYTSIDMSGGLHIHKQVVNCFNKEWNLESSVKNHQTSIIKQYSPFDLQPNDFNVNLL